MRGFTALKVFIAAFFTVGNPNAANAAERYEFDAVHMGTKCRIVLYAADKPTADTAAKAAFDRIAAIENVLSDYKDTSEIMTLAKANDAAPGRAFASVMISLVSL
jgi:FAD:protein FMN transferase